MKNMFVIELRECIRYASFIVSFMSYGTKEYLRAKKKRKEKRKKEKI